MRFLYYIILNFFLLINSSFSHTLVHVDQVEKEPINLQFQKNQLIKKKYNQCNKVSLLLVTASEIKNDINEIIAKYIEQLKKIINNLIKKLLMQIAYKANVAYIYKKKVKKSFFKDRKKQSIYDFMIMHHKNNYYLDECLSFLHTKIHKNRQKKAEKILEKIEEPVKNNQKLPSVIRNQLRINKDLFNVLSQQNQQMESILIQKKIVHSQIIQVRHVLNTLYEQSKWLKFSNLVGEALRTQLIHLPSPEIQKSKSIDNQLGDLHAKKLIYQNKLDHEKDILQQCFNENKDLDKNQKDTLIYQLKHRNNLLNLLIIGCDNLIIELNKLRISRHELKNILLAVKESTHRYLFWTADISPINFYYPVEVIHAFSFILSPNVFSQLYNSLLIIFSKKETLITIIISLLFIGLSLQLRKNFLLFLENTANQVGKVTQDHFYITLFTVFLSIIITAPPILLCATLGTALQRCWSYPIAVSLGEGIISTLPLLFIFMISAAFAEKNGLFLIHFQWSYNRVAHAMRYYRLIIWFIVPLIMLMVTFANFEEHQLSATLGRLCFICICGALSVVTSSFKRADIPLYLDKEGNCKNLINYFLWNVMIAIPILSAFAACIGYLETAKALLAKLEISVAIWFSLLVIYYIIRRWMLIQKRRIAFDRARQKRAEILANRSRSEEEKELLMQNADSVEIDEPIIDLDKISSQSLRLVRSILTLIALLSVIILWSDIHSAFSFLENIHLWEVQRTISNVNHVYPITLSSILITVLILFITAQLVRNMPALLELAILQHISLKPGTGYAITTLTKYFLMFIGGVIGFSFIGVEWVKLQWLVAALGVGLGFGLQEIFANFISGLIILFEKPIRIGDTVTLRNLTGSITRINTRATTIIDWDRKEIIVPNKAFITEQFINWSLSDSVTRIVLTIPAFTKESTEKITTILKKAAEMCSYVLTIPSPEVFLVDLQKGIQLFELRIYAAEIGHRMPLRHELHQLILKGFKEHNIDLPFPPTQIRTEIFHKNKKKL